MKFYAFDAGTDDAGQPVAVQIVVDHRYRPGKASLQTPYLIGPLCIPRPKAAELLRRFRRNYTRIPHRQEF